MRMSNNHAGPGTLTARIHAAYATLTESERKVADLVLKSPGEVAVLPANELAGRAGVSNASVSRLFKRLAYPSYDAARRAARELRASGSIFHLFDTANAEPAPQSDLISRYMAEETHALQLSLSMLNPRTVREIAAALAAAPRVWCVGFRNSRPVAEYACALFSAFRSDVFSLGTGGHSYGEAAASVHAGDAVLAFGMRRRMALFKPLLRELHAHGARIVLIGDRTLPAETHPAEWRLLTAVESSHPIDSFVGVMALTRVLALETLREQGAGAREMLAHIDTLHASLGELE